MSIYSAVANYLLSLRSFKTKRKLVVIESDDWGSRRTDNAEVRDKLNRISPQVASDPFTQLDNISTPEDISALFDVLNSVRDANGNPACVTINVTTANPDFPKIRESRFQKFFYEPFYETILRTDRGRQALDLWKTGIDEKLFFPQLHGREHVHALAWMKELQLGNKELLKAFDLNAYGIPYKALFKQRRKNLQAALDIYGLDGEEQFQETWVKESADIFEQYFGFRSRTFIPTAYTWHSRIESTLVKSGVSGMQGIKLQYQPRGAYYERKIAYTGQTRKSGLRSIARNVFYEPFDSKIEGCVTEALFRMESLFTKGHPVVIGSHRINYVGSICSNKRDSALKGLAKLLTSVLNRWPNVEFLTSQDLIKLIRKDEKNIDRIL